MTSIGKIGLGLGLLALLVAAGLLATQRQATLALRSEWALARAQNEEVARLRQANEAARARSLSAGELESLRSDHGVVERLRLELEELKRKSRPTAAVAGAVMTPLTAAEWRNAGRETPRATMETALWAATAGDPGVLGNTLELSSGAQNKAQALFASLNEDLRARYESPEKLVALLATQSIKVSAITIKGEQVNGDVANVQVVLQQPDAPPKLTRLTFHQADAAWRLVVPEGAVDGFAAALKGTVPPR